MKKQIFIFIYLLIGAMTLQAQDNGHKEEYDGYMAYFKENYTAAHTLYLQAAGKGNAKAMMGLGDLYKRGLGVTKNEEEAKKWFEKGRQRFTELAQSGDSEAAKELASMYYLGTNIEKNYAEALSYYLPKAQEGDVYAMGVVGNIYEKGGHGVTADRKKAAEWNLKAHDKGNDVTQNIQRKGVDAPQKLSAEDEYTQKLAKAGNEPNPSEYRGQAIAEYAKRLKEDGTSQATVIQKVKEKLLQMAEIDFYGSFSALMTIDRSIYSKELLDIFSQPQKDAIKDLANQIINKSGYPASAPARGQPWSAKSKPVVASNTTTQLANNGATEYNKGLEAYKAKNYDEALKLYKTAAGKGIPQAMYNLGLMYLKGEGVKTDLEEAFGWFKKAADKDFSAAMGMVGSMYSFGEGVDKDASEAFKWLKKATDKGNTNVLVMELLALAYEHGLGTAQNYTEAEKWFQKATTAGSKTAAVSLKIVQENKKHVAEAKVTFANSKVPKQLLPFKDDTNKYGFKDETGKIVVAPKYHNFEDIYFSEGMAMVLFSGKWGYVNQEGKEVIPPKYDQVQGFSDGMAAVRIGEKWGVIDKTGKMVVPPKYNKIGYYREGMADVNIGGQTRFLYGFEITEGGWGFIDKTGKEITPLHYDNVKGFFEGLASVERDKKQFYIDKTGKEVIHAKYNIAYSFQNGLAKVQNSNRQWGFINAKGEEVIPPAFEDVGDFSDGLASFQYPYHQQRNHKKGYIDKTGKEIVASQYDRASDFSEGMAAVGNGENIGTQFIGKWGFIDKTGKEIVPLRYNQVGNFSEGLAAVSLSGKWGFIDKRGIVVIPLEYSVQSYMFGDLPPGFNNGVAKVIKDGRTIYIDKTGKEIK